MYLSYEVHQKVKVPEILKPRAGTQSRHADKANLVDKT
jgi:hypothetical protein